MQIDPWKTIDLKSRIFSKLNYMSLRCKQSFCDFAATMKNYVNILPHKRVNYVKNDYRKLRSGDTDMHLQIAASNHCKLSEDKFS